MELIKDTNEFKKEDIKEIVEFLKAEIGWKVRYIELSEHKRHIELERNRLMGINEELRKKILALEAGQLELLDKLKAIQEQKSITFSDIKTTPEDGV